MLAHLVVSLCGLSSLPSIVYFILGKPLDWLGLGPHLVVRMTLPPSARYAVVGPVRKVRSTMQTCFCAIASCARAASSTTIKRWHFI